MFPLALLNASSPSSPPSPPVDPSLTLALLHFDTDYTDSSQTAAVWSNNWDSGQSISATSKFGAGSLATLGTGGIYTQNATVRTALGSGNWTIEGWFNKTAIGNDINGLFMFMGDSTSNYKQPITLYIENGILYAAVRFDASTRITISHQTTIVAGEFTHYALVRNGATITLYLNGVAGTTTINSGALSLYPSDILYCHISQARKVEYSTDTSLDGLHDEFRYRREAVYTGNFTPPTAPFTYVDYNTVLWLKFEGANGSTIFTDSSSQNNTITRYGSPSITTSNSKFGNSCLGINATSYLKINRSESFDIGAGQPFTIQMWLYITGGAGHSGGLISMRDAQVYCPIETNITNNGTLVTKIGNATLTDWGLSSFTMSTYVWRHFAIVGDGSLIKLYNHGVRQGDVFAQPHWPNDEYLLQINRNGDNQMQSCANIDHLSFHKTALWLSDFTPPTSEFTY